MKIEETARYIIYLANSEYDFLTPLKLQKLLYFCQGYSYVWNRKKLFSESFEAWKYGPVNREIYDMFRRYKQYQIPMDEAIEISESIEEETIRQVWNDYREFTAFELVEMTHLENPWKEAYREGLIIENRKIKKYFQENYS